MNPKITQKIGRILEQCPPLYHFSKTIYDKYYPILRLRHLEEILFGTKAREREWTMRDIHSAKNYWANRDNPVQVFFAEKICNFNFYPTSFLEIGSNCGPNLYQLAKKFSHAEIVGIDINKIAVQKGNEWFKQEGIPNVKLLVSRADDLKQFSDKSFDVVFTWAVLIYIGPDKIKKVMKEMIRITRKRLILLEMHDKDTNRDPQGLGVYCNIYWKRDYVALLRQFIPNYHKDKIHISKFPEDMWSPGVGGGTLIEFDMTLEEGSVLDWC